MRPTSAPRAAHPPQRREALVGTPSAYSHLGVPASYPTVSKFNICLPLEERQLWLWLWCLLAQLDHAPWCALSLLAQARQYFCCGSARPVGRLATKMSLHCRRQSWQCPECFTHFPSLFHQWGTSFSRQCARRWRCKDELDIDTALEQFRDMSKYILIWCNSYNNMHVHNKEYIHYKKYDSEALQREWRALSWDTRESWGLN
jgi:hypothetical protein